MVSKATADQIMTVTKERLTERIRSLITHELQSVEMAIRIQLGITP